MVEFHSMLGKYGKGKNRYELEKFEQKDSKKIKFMLLMNMGNEGMHAKCEREIHFRPTESSNLFLQLLGRVEYGILPNQIILDEDRPTVIDLVGNLFVYALNKEKNKVDDLDKLRIVVDWINNTGIIPSLDSTDKVEYMHAITLRSIKNKYIKYLTIEDKDKITTKIQEILRLGSMIDLWYIEYPEVIRSKNGSKRIITEDDTFFELTGVLQDLCELSKEVDNNLYMSFEEKVQELIETIKNDRELNGNLPLHYGKMKRLFRDGRNQRSFYNYLQQEEKRIREKKNSGFEITEEEQQKINAYERINVALNKEPFVKKVQELIETIKLDRELNGNLPLRYGEKKRFFEDGQNQRSFYNHLQQAAKRIQKKINNGIEITEEEQQKIDAYDKINAVCSNKWFEEKVQELISSIIELHRLPNKKKRNDNKTEKFFKDGTDQRNFYDHLLKDVKKIREKINNGSKLTEQEYQKLISLKKIEDVIRQMEVSSDEKIQELIKSIRELHRLPKEARCNAGQPEKIFRDGTCQKYFYDNLKQDVKKIREKINNGSKLTEQEYQKLISLKKIEDVIRQMEVSSDEKIQELIKSIHELHRLPKEANYNAGQPEKIFKDGTCQKNYYTNLKQFVKKLQEKINNGIKLTEDEQQKIDAYKEIERVLLFYPKSKASNKNMIIDLCNQYGIDTKINKSILGKSYYEVYTKIMYLIDNNIPIINNGTLCDIFYMADINMQLKYGVSMDELIDKYIINGKRL